MNLFCRPVPRLATLRSCFQHNVFTSLGAPSSGRFCCSYQHNHLQSRHSSGASILHSVILYRRIPRQTNSSLGSWCRSLTTQSYQLKELKASTGFRPATDHRGSINPGNRPDSEISVKEDEDSTVVDEAEYASLLHEAKIFGGGVVSESGLSGGMFVILPWIKWGPQQKNATTSQLLLNEACALATSLKDVTVIDKEIVKIRFEAKQTIFGTGQLITLTQKIRDMRGLSTVFVSIDILSRSQLRNLQQEFGVRVVDRYWLVLSIFNQHAYTTEAKMQVALAELPYLKTRTREDSEREIIDSRIKKLRAALRKVQRQRENVRQKRTQKDFPSIAVVGYTNTGKTSIISALSGDSSIVGRDQLFATLDVTAHGMQLPCGMRSVLIDTVGFIQDLPTSLLASFNATLQDAAHADVVLHVRDLSHPDRLMHHTTVMAALYSINLPSTTPIITLDNKADLITDVQQTSKSREDKQTARAPTTSADIHNCISYLSSDEQHKIHFQSESDATTVATEGEEYVTKLLVDESDMTNSERLQFLKEQYYSTPSLIVSAKTKKGLLNAVHAIEEQLLRVTNRRLYRMKLPTGGPQVSILRKIVGFSTETINEEAPEKTEIVTAMTEKQLATFKKRCRELAASNLELASSVAGKE
uniref:GTP-binding protein 6 n=1 Tax=Hirondellea gigas TaxID=1518452 RepID=A0A2P2I0J1_9CRUS